MQSTHLWATSDFVPRSEALPMHPGARGCIANPPLCGPLLILSPALHRCRPLRRQWLCSPSAPASDFVPRSEAADSQKTAGVGNSSIYGPLLILSLALKCWDPPNSRGCVANPPKVEPLLILLPALNNLGSPDGKGYRATSDSRYKALGTPQTVGVM